MRWLAVDPGDRHLGLAVSDPLGLVARPLTTLTHQARARDAERIVQLAAEHEAEGIVIGLPLDAEGEVGPRARKSERLAEAVRALTSLPVVLFDESLSSQEAQSLLIAAGKRRRARRTQEHAAAAALTLQSFLDANPPRQAPPPG
jgi:putative Holliday junction resolvase